MSDIDLAYCAGIVDGEGCIRIKKSKAYGCQGRKTPGYHALIQVRMVHREAIDALCEHVGGWFYTTKAVLRSRRPFFCWQMTDAKAESALRILLPFLRIKEPQARLVVALRDLQKDSRTHRTKVLSYRDFTTQHGAVCRMPNLALSDEYVARCERLYLDCKQLNRVGTGALTD